MVGFYTVVVDDRADYANRDRFSLADKVIVANPIESVFDAISFTDNSYIVIVTRGHLQDREVLERALQTPAKYIGMIGSKRKCELIYKYLKSKGWSETDLSRVNAPIGIHIKSETPEEIAVSIVAEMILMRASAVKA
jgi:xanthine dehydrogenase accessory factor